MQIIFEDKNERGSSGGTNTMDTVIYTGIIGRCMKRKLVERFGNRRSRIFVGIKKRIWGRR